MPETPWTQLAELPVTIEAYELERLSATASYGFERVTTLVRLIGGGTEGLGEDVSPFEDEANTLHVLGPVVPLAGEWTLGSLCAHLAGVDQWPIPPSWDVMRRWRNWAFESAALDLALRQAGRALHEVLGRRPRPLRFVNSLGLGDPPTFDPIGRRLDHHPELRFKLDAHPAWTPELIGRLVDTGAVEIVDFKGHYGLEVEDEQALLGMYERVVAALEDAHDRPEVAALLAAEDRIAYDAPIHAPDDVDATPLRPQALNIKPCRVGTLRTLLDVYSACDARGLITYGGGMGELGVGRGQIQLLASLFHPDGPNDTAPSGYNTDTPAADLPASPLEPAPAPTGFRRAP
jgi:L-alanine-DL-glutamate epimerase-like enolase superfamily enzyme